jgi:GH43 family beta-xylosidase
LPRQTSVPDDYGPLANPVRHARLAKIRELLDVVPEFDPPPDDTVVASRPALGRALPLL